MSQVDQQSERHLPITFSIIRFASANERLLSFFKAWTSSSVRFAKSATSLRRCSYTRKQSHKYTPPREDFKRDPDLIFLVEVLDHACATVTHRTCCRGRSKQKWARRKERRKDQIWNRSVSDRRVSLRTNLKGLRIPTRGRSGSTRQKDIVFGAG